MLIPNSVLGALTGVLADAFTHKELDRVFHEAGAPGEAPVGNKNVTVRAWLKRLNTERPDRATAILGSILAELLEMEPTSRVTP